MQSHHAAVTPPFSSGGRTTINSRYPSDAVVEQSLPYFQRESQYYPTAAPVGGHYHHRYPFHLNRSAYYMMSEKESIKVHENDVLMGRGGKNNQHSGNEKLRLLARDESENYRESSKKGKSAISRDLVQRMRTLDPPARFLKRSTSTGEWEDVGDEVAREKASQVLRDAVALLPEELEGTPVGSGEHDQQYAAQTAHLTVSGTHDDMDRRGAGPAEASMTQNRITPGLTSTPSFPPGSSPRDSDSSRKRHRHHYQPPYPSEYPPHSSYSQYPPTSQYHSHSSAGSHQAYGPPIDVPPYHTSANGPYDRSPYDPSGYRPPYPHPGAYTPSSSGRLPNRSYYGYGHPPPPDVFRSMAPHSQSGQPSPRDSTVGYEYAPHSSGPPPHERSRSERHSYPSAEFNPPPPAPGMHSPPSRWKRKSPPDSASAASGDDVDDTKPPPGHHKTPSNDYRSSYPPYVPPPRQHHPGTMYHPGSPYSVMYHPGSPPPRPAAVFPYASSPPLRRPRSLAQGGRQESSATQSSRSLFGDELLQGDLLESDHENSPNNRGRQQQQPGEPTTTAVPVSVGRQVVEGAPPSTEVRGTTLAGESSDPPSTPPQSDGS